MAKIGFADPSSDEAPCRWIALRHGLSKGGNDHVHIVVSLVREDGSKASTWNDRPRAQQAAGELEREHGLEVLESRGAGHGARESTPAERGIAERRQRHVPAGCDPADVAVGPDGPKAVATLIGASVPMVSFRVEHELAREPLTSAEAKDRAIDALRPVFAELPSSAQREELLQTVATATQLPVAEVTEWLRISDAAPDSVPAAAAVPALDPEIEQARAVARANQARSPREAATPTPSPLPRSRRARPRLATGSAGPRRRVGAVGHSAASERALFRLRYTFRHDGGSGSAGRSLARRSDAG